MVIITGANGGVGRPLTQKVISSGQLCCAIVRRTQEFYEAGTTGLKTTDYNMSSFIELLNDTDDVSDVKLVLNAFDISPIKMATDLTTEDINKNIEFNIVKQLDIVIKAYEYSVHNTVGFRIVALDSGAAYRPINGWSMYCAGKAYMSMFLKVFAQEKGIPLVLYDPGVVDTNMQKRIRNSSERDFPTVDTFRHYYSSQLLNSPESVANDIFKRYLLNWTAKSICEKYGKSV